GRRSLPSMAGPGTRSASTSRSVFATSSAWRAISGTGIEAGGGVPVGGVEDLGVTSVGGAPEDAKATLGHVANTTTKTGIKSARAARKPVLTCIVRERVSLTRALSLSELRGRGSRSGSLAPGGGAGQAEGVAPTSGAFVKSPPSADRLGPHTTRAGSARPPS